MNPLPARATAGARIWLLISERAGETRQQRALAAALAEPCAEWRIVGDQLLDAQGQPAAAPWPEVAIAFGKGLAAAKRLRQASGGKTRIVLLGRPRRTPCREIALIVPMPQDRMPPAANLLAITMPLARAIAGKARPRSTGNEAWAALPRPWTALLVGGETQHNRFDAGTAAALGRAASADLRACGGSLLVTTSRRTGAAAARALRAALDVPHHFHEFRPDDPANPLPAWLAQADRYIVTADSGSMLAEAWRTGRPVSVAPVPPRRGLRPLLKRTALALLPPRLHAALIDGGLISAPVDLAGWVEARIADGHFGQLGGVAPRLKPGDAGDVDDTGRVAARVRALLAPER